MFKKKLGGIIQVDGEEDTLDTAAVEEPVAAEAANAPVSEDVWDSDEEKAAKRELQEQSIVIGKAAVITGDLGAKGPVTITGVVHGNVSCEDKICIRGEVVGNITAKSVLVMDGGRVQGNIASTTDLVLQTGAAIEGDLVAAKMNLEGSLTGNINCSGDLCLGAKSVVTGDISTTDICTTLGAHINGRGEMKG